MDAATAMRLQTVEDRLGHTDEVLSRVLDRLAEVEKPKTGPVQRTPMRVPRRPTEVLRRIGIKPPRG